MLNEQTITKLNELRLVGMAKGFGARIERADHNELSHAEFTGLLVDDEKTHRENQRLTRLLKRARLRQEASLENIDYQFPRGLAKAHLLALSNGAWITHHQNILITGKTGLGKSYIACALGNQACRMGYTTTYLRMARLFDHLFTARADGSHLKVLERLARTQVLILDDFAMSPLNDRERNDLLEIIEDRHQGGTIVMTSQVPTKEWHTVIGEPTVADAICDRLFHNAIRIELKGESMRKKISIPNSQNKK